MKIKTKSHSILYSDPFQLQLPESHGLKGGSTDAFYTFRLEIGFGPGGIEGTIPLFVIEKDGKEDDPSWWSCFGLTQIPGLQPATSDLRLYFENCTFFDCNQGVIASWDESDPLFRDEWGSMWSAAADEEDLPAAADLIKRLLAEKFPLREITDPANQIPGYKPEHHATLFGE